MRKILFFVAITLHAQSVQLVPDCFQPFSMTAVAVGATYDNRQAGCTTWTITYSNTGFAAVTLNFQSAPNASGVPGAWVDFLGTIVTGVNPNVSTTQAFTVVTGYNPFVRANLTVAGGAGTVSGLIYGYKTPAVAQITATLSSVATAAADGASNTQSIIGRVFNFPHWFNGATWDRARGNTSGLFAQGPVADGSAVGGNPVLMGLYDGTNVKRLRGSGGADGGVISTVFTAAGADGVSNATIGRAIDQSAGTSMPSFAPFTFNGSTWDRAFTCTNQAAITLTAAGSTQIIAASGATVVRICHISLAAASAEDIKIVYGTGVNCATGPVDMTGLYRNTSSFALDFQPTAALKTVASQAVCVNQSGAVNAGGVVVYAQY